MYICDNKMKNPLLAIFDKSCSFLSNLKIHKKSKFNLSQFKLYTQHKNMYAYQKNL